MISISEILIPLLFLLLYVLIRSATKNRENTGKTVGAGLLIIVAGVGIIELISSYAGWIIIMLGILVSGIGIINREGEENDIQEE